MSAEPAVLAEGLVKKFGGRPVVNGVDLEIAPGTVMGVLGPNGAGKTTALRILSTLLRPDGGRARVFGHDVVAEPSMVRRQISVTGQDASMDEDLTGTENLVLLGMLSGYSYTDAHGRARELLHGFQLADAATRQVRHYSGGMRRRLDIAASVVTTPRLLFLDEPTTGLDPHSRSQVWDIVRAIADQGTTVLLTTQYLEEADRLASRIAVIDNGQVIAEGTPGELRTATGAGTVTARLRDPGHADGARRALERALHAPVTVATDTRTLTAQLGGGQDTVGRAAAALGEMSRQGIDIDDFVLGRPSLDEVFLALTENRP